MYRLLRSLGLSRPAVSAGAAALAMTVAGSAVADPTDRVQLAQSLFEQARALMDRGEYTRACAMLVESQRLDPGDGTQLNLALCHEGEGKLATALSELSDALGRARRDGRTDRALVAEDHIRAITPRVPSISLALPPAIPSGFVLELDGVAIGASAAGAPLRADPGRHVVNASAPGYVAWSSVLDLAAGEARVVLVPSLRAGDVASSDASPAQPSTHWYGAPILLVDGAAYAMAGVAYLGSSVPLGLVASGIYALGSPSIHWSRGRIGVGFASLALRVGSPVMLGLIGLYVDDAVHVVGYSKQVAAATDAKDFTEPAMDYTFTGVGAGIGVVAASVIDAALLARAKEPNPKAARATPDPQRPRATLQPRLTPKFVGLGVSVEL